MKRLLQGGEVIGGMTPCVGLTRQGCPKPWGPNPQVSEETWAVSAAMAPGLKAFRMAILGDGTGRQNKPGRRLWGKTRSGGSIRSLLILHRLALAVGAHRAREMPGRVITLTAVGWNERLQSLYQQLLPKRGWWNRDAEGGGKEMAISLYSSDGKRVVALGSERTVLPDGSLA